MNQRKIDTTKKSSTARAKIHPAKNQKSSTNKQYWLIKRKHEEPENHKQNCKNHQTTPAERKAESILVCDRGTQCSKNYFDTTENPPIIKQLVKDLRELVCDERSKKIVATTEQVLCGILSMKQGKSLRDEIEKAVLLESRLQATTVKFEATREKLKETNATWQREKESLANQIKESQRKEEEMRLITARMHNDWKEAEKTRKSHEKLILQLSKEKEELSLQLNEEMHNRFVTEQYLKMEKERYQVLWSYKDKLVNELKSSMTELENDAIEQFGILKDSYKEKDRERLLQLDNEFTCLSTSFKSSSSKNALSPNVEIDQDHAFVKSRSKTSPARKNLENVSN